jgi:hypothetical protein
VVLNAFIQFKTIIGGILVNVILFQRPSEPFDPDIVQRSSFSIQQDLYHLLFDAVGPDSSAIPATLI